MSDHTFQLHRKRTHCFSLCPLCVVDILLGGIISGKCIYTCISDVKFDLLAKVSMYVHDIIFRLGMIE